MNSYTFPVRSDGTPVALYRVRSVDSNGDYSELAFEQRFQAVTGAKNLRKFGHSNIEIVRYSTSLNDFVVDVDGMEKLGGNKSSASLNAAHYAALATLKPLVDSAEKASRKTGLDHETISTLAHACISTLLELDVPADSLINFINTAK